jgi:predicted ester cyclase
MNAIAGATRNLEVAAELVEQCWDPPRPDVFARFTTNAKSRFIFEAFALAFPDARLEVTWLVGDDRRVAIGGRLLGTHRGPWRDVPPTGRTVDVACVFTLAIEDGVVIDTATVSDSFALAEQVGAVAPLGPRACQLFEQSR